MVRCQRAIQVRQKSHWPSKISSGLSGGFTPGL
jgi:hypothetical protein